MLEQFFLTINGWMSGGLLLAALGCFLWGAVSVLFSPCHLASIPLIVGYVGGQDRLLGGRQAAHYALLFTFGLFLTIAAVGVACALLGRMLGDVGPWWTVLVGGILIWVALDMLGVAKCKLGGNLMDRFRLRGRFGAFVLGLAYGVLSGSCTFGFIAPILAVITVQQRIADGVLLILLFGIGHCLPIAFAGSSVATVRKLLESTSLQEGSRWFRRGAGALIAGLGVYFLARPFL
ncbi:MAG TPA: cytochrome c biogenesis protein CcdA [Desulfovibrio sp.]|uniref:cytochrome c biogenesis CcdA family protein n=1 Tax=Desulfovibrio sp. TaxID=885 RepID=UPI002C2E47CC|nr:cytochrome c biogenesis protein CcdA [Desulfovibrio sp.]HMM39298.1 cytochrome c biogenesis protein CcdA [Desulfovibrio sp.]